MEFTHFYFQQTSSTNQLVQEMSKNEGYNAICVRADFQTAGRGIAQNSWFSTAGKNLLLSLGLKIGAIKAENQFVITKIVSLALLKTLKENVAYEEFSIKWPNDIYWKKKKLAGILISNTIFGGNIEYSIIGIGLNLNEIHFPQSLPNPVSLIQITHNETDIEAFMASFLEIFQQEIIRFFGHKKAIDEEYLNHLLYYNKKMAYLANESPICGTIRGINSYGHLHIEVDGQDDRFFDLKELVFLHESCV